MSKDGPVPGQIPAFFPDEREEKPVVELPYVGPGVEREEIVRRAGTLLDHRWTHKVIGQGRRGKIVHGLYDERQRVYQTGGEMSQFIFWKKKLVSLSLEAYRLGTGAADWIEIIDHERNECWRIATGKFRKHAVKYNAGIGDRIGCPMELWDVITARGTLRQEGHKS